MKIKFALDLTWVRHKIVGGTESFSYNLIRGFMDIDEDYEMYLIASTDNACLFTQFTDDPRINMLIAPINSSIVSKRIIWQNLELSSFLLKNNINLCLEPVYAKPILRNKGVKYVTVIHDLEALHFPKNHSILTNIWLRVNWKNTVRTSKHIICISNFVKEDIMNTYKLDEDKITTIYDPIMIDVSKQSDFLKVSNQYGIKEKEYYYTVSKLNPHKNLTTLVKVFGEIKKREINIIPCKLLISGVNGGMADKLRQLAEEYNLKDEIVLTGFVEDEVRNCLYCHAKAFLFPSIFEGFGMPPIEAISTGTTVITTKEACIPEITQYMANYVDDPYSIDEWIDKMINMKKLHQKFNTDIYLPSNIAKKYLQILSEVNTKG